MGDLVMFQQMGFGVAVALLIDATIIRSVLLPAAMSLLGDWNWYLPRWLAWLPQISIESHAPRAPQPSPSPNTTPNRRRSATVESAATTLWHFRRRGRRRTRRMTSPANEAD